MKNQKGITLVALIITIIVMLILVAVTVAVVVDSDIIGQAESAGEAYEQANDGLNNVAHQEIVKDSEFATVNQYKQAADNAISGR